jgi:hypothetical protein
MLPQGMYFWRVYRQGEDVSHLEGYPFYVVPTIGEATAMPEYPYNGMSLGVSDIENGLYVQWKKLTVAPTPVAFSNSYILELSTSSTFATLVDFRIVIGGAPSESAAMLWDDIPVLDGKTYYWRVRGIFGATAEELGPNPDINDFLELDAGPVGGVYTFKVDLTVPGTPTQNLPIANALVTTRTPTFTWGAATGTPTRYRVEISQDAAFTTLLWTSSVNAPAVTLTLPAYQSLANGAYYWRVVAIDLADNESVPSVGRRLIIAAP